MHLTIMLCVIVSDSNTLNASTTLYALNALYWFTVILIPKFITIQIHTLFET